jgi:peptidoglycan L-alanyl-D-glutamate endopeptidase CwlK
MPQFSAKSLGKLKECHPLLQRLMNDVIKTVDFSVICGYRGKEDQELAYQSGHSKLRWPQSKHNSSPSLAVDIVPYPIDWENIASFHMLSDEVKDAWDRIPESERDGFELSWGGDWKKFRDYPHYELRKR